MKVYLLLREFDCEGHDVIGVYTTYQQAESQLVEWAKARMDHKLAHDGERIVEFEVDGNHSPDDCGYPNQRLLGSTGEVNKPKSFRQ